jgi:hypothetical protein
MVASGSNENMTGRYFGGDADSVRIEFGLSDQMDFLLVSPRRAQGINHPLVCFDVTTVLREF